MRVANAASEGLAEEYEIDSEVTKIIKQGNDSFCLIFACINALATAREREAFLQREKPDDLTYFLDWMKNNRPAKELAETGVSMWDLERYLRHLVDIKAISAFDVRRFSSKTIKPFLLPDRNPVDNTGKGFLVIGNVTSDKSARESVFRRVEAELDNCLQESGGAGDGCSDRPRSRKKKSTIKSSMSPTDDVRTLMKRADEILRSQWWSQKVKVEGKKMRLNTDYYVHAVAVRFGTQNDAYWLDPSPGRLTKPKLVSVTWTESFEDNVAALKASFRKIIDACFDIKSIHRFKLILPEQEEGQTVSRSPKLYWGEDEESTSFAGDADNHVIEEDRADIEEHVGKKRKL